MFGRRTPDQPHDSLPPAPSADRNLDILPDLADIDSLIPAEPEKPEPPSAPLEVDPAWHSSATMGLGPSVTRMLQEAEAASAEQPEAPPTTPQPAFSPPPPPLMPPPALRHDAPAPPTPRITQQLTSAPPPPSPIQAPTPPAMSNNQAARPRSASESVIGPDDFFDGRYRSERGVRIQGTVRGSIESRQYIFVEASAQVEADLSAEDITIAGSFSGKIECRRRLEVNSSGKIHGSVQTVLLVVQEGGLIDGELHMQAANTDPA